MNTKRLTDYLGRNGLKSTCYAVLQHIKDRAEDVRYDRARASYTASGEELDRQRSHVWDEGCRPLISILVPVYKPKNEYFRQMLRSVRAQTYGSYELILGYGGGISENTNAALSEAKGDYIALLDQDDMIEPDALFYIAEEINKGARLIYTDEDKYDTGSGRYLRPFRKKGFDMELLLSNNYICHFLVIERELVLEAGGFRSEYDGAQDHDLIIRCAERLDRNEIAHVDRILYHWRIHDESTAGDPAAKDYAHLAGKRAIEDHLKRCGMGGRVTETAHRGFYRVVYDECASDSCVHGIKDYEMYLEPDISPEKDRSISDMAAYLAANKDVGAIGGRVVDRMGHIISSGYTEDTDGHLIPLYQGMNRNLSGKFHMASLRQEVSAVSRHCVMLRKETVDCMDTDTGRMCRKIKEKGYRIVIDPEHIFIRR